MFGFCSVRHYYLSWLSVDQTYQLCHLINQYYMHWGWFKSKSVDYHNLSCDYHWWRCRYTLCPHRWRWRHRLRGGPHEDAPRRARRRGNLVLTLICPQPLTLGPSRRLVDNFTLRNDFFKQKCQMSLKPMSSPSGVKSVRWSHNTDVARLEKLQF